MSVSVRVPDRVTDRRWWALAAVSAGQLMIAADATIMNVALPTVARTLELSTSQRQWVITVFALCYAGFLLLGGRLSALWGPRRCLLLGLAGFAVASVLGGVAVNGAMILGARALQGASGALFTPSVLALLGTTFAGGQRARAYAVYGTVMGSSSGVGLLLGGVITEVAGWRWSLLIGAPVAALVAGGVVVAVRSGSGRVGARLDVGGAVLGTAGLMAVVLGFSQAESAGWAAARTWVWLAVGVVVVGAFVAYEGRVEGALLPLRVVRDRRRAGAYLAVFTMAVGSFAAFFLLTFHVQVVWGYAPVWAGVAFLPYTVAIVVGVRLVRRFLTDAPVRLLLVPGLLVIAVGLAGFGFLDVGGSYVVELLPVVVLFGLGTSWVMTPSNSVATQDAGADTGVAGALVMISMHVGSSVGIAVLGGVAATVTQAAVGAGVGVDAAAVRGYRVAGVAAAVFVVVSAGLVWWVLGRVRTSGMPERG